MRMGGETLLTAYPLTKYLKRIKTKNCLIVTILLFLRLPSVVLAHEEPDEVGQVGEDEPARVDKPSQLTPSSEELQSAQSLTVKSDERPSSGLVHSSSILTPSNLGWFLGALAGLQSCIPSTDAGCDQVFPGGSLGLSTGYRWRFVGIKLNGDWGTLIPTGNGSEHVKIRSYHIGLGLLGYLPLVETYTLYSGLSLGAGDLSVHDTASDSMISWSSLWSDLRWELGGQSKLSSLFTLELALSINFHLGGSRCLNFQGAGPCEPISNLKQSEQQVSPTGSLRVGITWSP